jgi:hypothetical protein
MMTNEPLGQEDIGALAYLLDCPLSAKAHLRALRMRGEEVTLKAMADHLRDEGAFPGGKP